LRDNKVSANQKRARFVLDLAELKKGMKNKGIQRVCIGDCLKLLGYFHCVGDFGANLYCSKKIF